MNNTTKTDRALKILGADHVVTRNEHVSIWQDRPKYVAIAYPEEDLLKAKAENDSGEANWFLAYLSGKSMLEQYRAKPDQFHAYPWWLAEKKECEEQNLYKHWINRNFQAGYYLIDLSKFGIGQSWSSQEKSLEAIQGIRCWEEMISELLVTLQIKMGKPIFLNFSFWGRIDIEDKQARIDYEKYSKKDDKPVDFTTIISVGYDTINPDKVVMTRRFKEHEGDIRLATTRVWRNIITE